MRANEAMQERYLGVGMTSTPNQIRGSIVVSISACHAEDPGSIPGRGVVSILHALVLEAIWEHDEAGFESAIRSED